MVSNVTNLPVWPPVTATKCCFYGLEFFDKDGAPVYEISDPVIAYAEGMDSITYYTATSQEHTVKHEAWAFRSVVLAEAYDEFE